MSAAETHHPIYSVLFSVILCAIAFVLGLVRVGYYEFRIVESSYADEILPEEPSTTELIDPRAAAHFEALEEALFNQEKKLLEQMGSKSSPARPQMMQPTVGESASVEPATPIVPRYLETPTSPRATPSSSAVATVSDDVVSTLEKQQGELSTIARGFEELVEKSEKLERTIQSVEDVILDERVKEIVAASKDMGTDAGAQNGTLELSSSSSPAETSTPEAKEEQPSVLSFNFWRTRIAIPRRSTRRVEQILQFGDIRINSDMPVAEVTSEAVAMRAGPGVHFDSLFRAEKGEVVAIERRYENWYRVVHQTGIRGWVINNDVLFGPDSRSLPGKIIRIKPYDPASDRTDWEAAT